MFNITKDNVLIATVDKLSFVKRQDNGIIVNCPESDAHGIVLGDAYYHLPWLPLFPGSVDVTVEEFNGAAMLSEIQEAINNG